MEYSKPLIGFSTGSIALGDFKTGISYLKERNVDVIELSTLRESEFFEFLKHVDVMDLSSFKYVSFHAPSRLVTLTEADLVQLLMTLAEKKWLIVVHPDIISNFYLWEALGDSLCIENMDKRKSIGRTASDLDYIFNKLPKASFCFDVAHARQVDPTMSEAKVMLHRFGDRLKQIHISDLNSESKHEALSLESVLSYCKLFETISEHVPVILESPVNMEDLEGEIETAALIFNQEKLIDFIRPYSRYSSYFHYYVDHYSKTHS